MKGINFKTRIPYEIVSECSAFSVEGKNGKVTVKLNIPSCDFVAHKGWSFKGSWVGLYVVDRDQDYNYVDSIYPETEKSVVTFTGVIDGIYEVRYFSDEYHRITQYTAKVVVGTLVVPKKVEEIFDAKRRVVEVTFDCHELLDMDWFGLFLASEKSQKKPLCTKMVYSQCEKYTIDLGELHLETCLCDGNRYVTPIVFQIRYFRQHSTRYDKKMTFTFVPSGIINCVFSIGRVKALLACGNSDIVVMYKTTSNNFFVAVKDDHNVTVFEEKFVNQSYDGELLLKIPENVVLSGTYYIFLLAAETRRIIAISEALLI
ncbi:hypothetical protein EIN_470240 [Entamoeba invadens IP1]|uniref:Uncharacterized protein n=1 Tax=Entamoeba invadens IP1 TaxID=370355 RepID=A0A0A1TUN0_ENTIV|nr:hypothetical protein EIN_470240 [Entamoeba invadens IP1]ELP83780.1 hypothetical protein EIN_470240 [Entamoeba invadens IP1]|eukprot:XP_004183126.1 hypothetical protein EIN_470240 [Entamoeba invadens IP1]